MSYLSLSSPCDRVLRPLWSAVACHPLTSLALLPHAPIGRICGHLFLHRCIRRSSNCIWFASPTHYQCLCRVSLMCFRVRLALTFLTPTTCMRLFRLDSHCVSAIRFSHVTCYLLLDCSLLRLLISLVHFFPPFKRHVPYQHPKKANDSPLAPLYHIRSFHPFAVLTRAF